MLVGAVDMMEGSVVILPGSGLVALGTYLGHRDRRWIIYRIWVFALIAIGVGALWGMSMIGGIGGKNGPSMWWSLLIAPYPIGWTMGIWGPGSPRWLLALGILISTFHFALVPLILKNRPEYTFMAFILGALGLVTVIGCLLRWRSYSGAKLLGTQTA